jgi:hypothetical protein
MWDGTTQDIGGSYDTFGYVPALSLWVSIRDLADDELFFCTGGIQVVSSIDSGFWSSEFAAVPSAELLTDERRNAAAVTTCLEPLLSPPAAPPP